MGTQVNGRLRIYTYTGKKGDYKITHINKKPYFVIITNKNNGEFIERVNLKTLKQYTLYIGDYSIKNDLVFI